MRALKELSEKLELAEFAEFWREFIQIARHRRRESANSGSLVAQRNTFAKAKRGANGGATVNFPFLWQVCTRTVQRHRF